ncbi:MAG: hypothetical protein IJ733_01160 [Lachnospiraceae bacterium]|nr:hypothetical protein [Lachnospiraceae bacterium]
MSSDAHTVKKEWKKVLEKNELLIMPAATIIETGNHIAHIAEGNVRRSIAGKFGEYLKRTANNDVPWKLYNSKSMDRQGLLYLADHVEEFSTCKIGLGDLSIIYDYNQYRETVPAIGSIMIWSTDEHLKSYHEENISIMRRRKHRCDNDTGEER